MDDGGREFFKKPECWPLKEADVWGRDPLKLDIYWYIYIVDVYVSSYQSTNGRRNMIVGSLQRGIIDDFIISLKGLMDFRRMEVEKKT